MGFRNPITSAAAVDTGQPAGAAARVYEGSDATGVFGVLEFRDGISGDSPAQAIGRANLVPQGGGYTQQGGGLAVKGGSYNGVTAPEIDLNVEAIPAGGYGPVARISAPFQPVSVVNAPALAAGWTNLTGLEKFRFYLLADGLVMASGLIQNSSGVAKGGVGTTTTLCSIPAGYVPVVTAVTAGIGSQSVGYRVDFTSSGLVQLVDCPTLPNTAYLQIRASYRLDTIAN